MRIHLGGSSRQSLETARTHLDAAVKGASTASASDLSAELFFAAEVLVKTGFCNTHLCSHLIDGHGIKAFFRQEAVHRSRDRLLTRF